MESRSPRPATGDIPPKHTSCTVTAAQKMTDESAMTDGEPHASHGAATNGNTRDHVVSIRHCYVAVGKYLQVLVCKSRYVSTSLEALLME